MRLPKEKSQRQTIVKKNLDCCHVWVFGFPGIDEIYYTAVVPLLEKAHQRQLPTSVNNLNTARTVLHIYFYKATAFSNF